MYINNVTAGNDTVTEMQILKINIISPNKNYVSCLILRVQISVMEK